MLKFWRQNYWKMASKGCSNIDRYFSVSQIVIFESTVGDLSLIDSDETVR